MDAHRKAALTRMAIVAIAVMVVVVATDPAYAQDPFGMARQKACQAQVGLKRLAGAVGMLGIMVALMLGYFNKLNWRWISTAIGASFALTTIPGIILWAGGTNPC